MTNSRRTVTDNEVVVQYSVVKIVEMEGDILAGK